MVCRYPGNAAENFKKVLHRTFLDDWIRVVAVIIVSL